jgi:OOP family OmpA-OmpF porin
MRYAAFIILSLLLVSLQAQEINLKNFPYIQPVSVEKPDTSSKNYFADSDQDGVRDDKDKCPDTKANAHVDLFGCIILDDDDKDGVSNANDKCPQTPEKATVNLEGCEPDNDNDGVPDAKDKCPDTEEGFLIDSFGCPQAKTLNIHFKTKDFRVSDDFLPELEEFANFLRDNEEYQVIIYGYTDNQEAPHSDKQLAQKRANAVMNIIISHGVKLTRLTAIGMGSENPIKKNDSAENRANNRRIEVELLQ